MIQVLPCVTAGSGERARLERPLAKMAPALRKLRREYRHSEPDMGAPFGDRGAAVGCPALRQRHILPKEGAVCRRVDAQVECIVLAELKICSRDRDAHDRGSVLEEGGSF